MTASTHSPTTVLSLRGISKRFGAVQALRNVTVECRAGEIHAVVGENGSGKSTLLGIASGVVAPDDGSIEIAGHPLPPAHAAEARRLGLGTAYQTYSHVLDLSVAENLFLAAPRAGRPSFGRMHAWARDQLRAFRVDIPVETRMGALQLADRQFLEVVKVLLSDPKVLLLDEPTTALGPAEVDRLHELVLARAADGVGIVYVSHRLPEVLGLADRVSVLRDGEHQGTYEATEMTEESLVALMIGRQLELSFAEHDATRSTGNVVLQVKGLDGNRVGPIDLEVHEGEILGIAGAAGNGQDELLRCLAGIERASGSVICRGAPVDLRSPHSALRAGIMFLSGERVRECLFPVLGVRSNSTVQVLRRFTRLGWVHRGREHDAVVEMVGRLKVRTPSIEQPVRFLSGGNQQKVVLGRELDVHPVLFVVSQPTRGLDIAATDYVHRRILAARDAGAAVLLISSELDEIRALSDRIAVLFEGRLVATWPAAGVTEEQLGLLMAGHAEATPAA